MARERDIFPIVGVGASAGGLDAFRQLLGALPIDTGMAFVLVQHLDPSHESILAELLAKGSRMPVSEVKGDTAVEPDHVYVTPGRNDVAIEAGVLKLVPRITTGGRHLPIDSFLRTLAEARGSQAIGVILSGTGSDGTLGARAIKGARRHRLRPGPGVGPARRHAAQRHRLGVRGLHPAADAHRAGALTAQPPSLRDHSARPRAGGRAGARVGGETDGFRSVLAILRRTTGSDFSAYKPPTIRRRIARRMALASVQTLEEYADYLEGHADEAQALHQECLITVTSFFRDPSTFEVLSREVLPRAAEGSAARRAGAGVGARVRHGRGGLLDRHLPAGSRGRAGGRVVSCQVFGTDLSESAVEKARAGRYLSQIAQDVSPARLKRFFAGGGRRLPGDQDHPRHVRLRAARRDPRSAVRPHGPDQLPQRADLPRAADAAEGHGHPPLRPADLGRPAAGDVGDGEHGRGPLHARGQEAPDLPQAARRRAVPLRVRRFAGGVERGRRAGRRSAKPSRREELPREADRILLARYAPAGVIVDDKDQISSSAATPRPYLEHVHGRASLNLFKMARKGLLLELRRAIQEARKKDAPIRKEGVSLRRPGPAYAGSTWRSCRCGDLPTRGARCSCCSSRAPRPGARAAARHDGGRWTPPRLVRRRACRRELSEATQYLQAVTEQHEAANEELQATSEEVLSANEELQSINEELETAKEELQASNEELATLNQELQGRNLQLERALEYANGIVETVRNPLLILNADLRVERANRSFYDYFRVAPEETVGRLVYELGEGQWDIPALRHMLDELLRRVARVEDVEVEHDFPRVGPRTLIVNARKLHRESGHESLLLAFEDRSAARNSEIEREALLALEQQARQRAEQADRIKDEFMATLSHELRGPLSAMVGWVHVLRGEGLDEATRERGRAAIERSSKAQTRLIEDLLDYSSVVAGKLTLSPRLMDLVPVAGAAIEAARSAAEAKGIRLELEYGPARRRSSTAIRTGCSRCSGTCCRTQSSSRRGAGGSRSRSDGSPTRSRSG